jgi:glutamyl-tRNA synthetase
LIRERITTLDESVDFGGFFFKAKVSYDPQDLVAKGLSLGQSLDAARRSLELLSGLEEITPSIAEPPMRELVERLGYNPGQVFGILRVAVTGQKVSPPLFESMEIIGRETVLKRVASAVALLEALA